MDLESALTYASQTRSATLITLRKDGRSQSSDIAYAVVDGTVRISVTSGRAKTANVQRDPRVVLHISRPGSYTYLSFDGTAEVSAAASAPDDDTVDELVELYRAVSNAEHPDWIEFRQAMVDEKRAIITMTPTSVVGMINE